MTGQPWPSVSVVMPIRNEAAFIERSLGAMLDQDYPGEMEVICVDGMSDDGTRDIVERIALADPRVRLIDNPRRIIPTALNIGIHHARHALIIRMDGHTRAPPDYVRLCVQTWQQTGADNVGGQWVFEGETFIARAVGAAMDSMFGVGTGRWRGAKTPGETDTVPFGLWERDRLIALGGFDETLTCNEDYEFNYRLRAAGGRVYYSPQITTIYYSRQNLSALWRQYFQYGLSKPRVLKMHPQSFQLRHGIAPLFVLGLVAGVVLFPFGRLWRWLYGAALAVYLLLSIFFSARQSMKHGWSFFPVLPLVFAILHVSWGAGFLAGVWRWWIRREDERGSQ
jgi:succinoglycan biosynthesis protein ExoA